MRVAEDPTHEPYIERAFGVTPETDAVMLARAEVCESTGHQWVSEFTKSACSRCGAAWAPL